MLAVAREIGLPFIELTTDTDNAASQRVITGNAPLYFDVQVTDATGDVRTVVSGTLPLTQDVTRD